MIVYVPTSPGLGALLLSKLYLCSNDDLVVQTLQAAVKSSRAKPSSDEDFAATLQRAKAAIQNPVFVTNLYFECSI